MTLENFVKTVSTNCKSFSAKVVTIIIHKLFPKFLLYTLRKKVLSRTMKASSAQHLLKYSRTPEIETADLSQSHADLNFRLIVYYV